MNRADTSFWGRGRHLSLDAKRIAWTLTITTLLAAVIQMLISAAPLTLAVAVISSLAGLAVFAWAGVFNVGAWVVFFFVFGNVLVPIWSKTLLGQPLDSNLYEPLSAFVTVAVGVVALSLALVLARATPVGRPLLQPTSNQRHLFVLSWGAFFLGALAWYWNRQFLDDPDGMGFGGLSWFKSLLLMAVIARTALLLERSGYQRSMDVWLGLMLLTCAFFGLVDNAKTDVALPFVSYFVTVLFFRRSAPLRVVVASAAAGIVFVLAVGPLIHVYRWMDIQQVPMTDRVQLLRDGLESSLRQRDFSWTRQVVLAQFEQDYYDYFGGGEGQMLLGRYASVQQVDPIVAQINRQGTLGASVVWPSLWQHLPRFLYPDKPEFGESYWIVVNLGLIDPAGGKFPTVPLVAQAYAGYGLTGLLTIPFVTFLILLLILKKLGWNLNGNVYAIFFFSQFVIVYANQGDLSQYGGAALRGFPSFALIFIALGWATRIGSRRSTGVPVLTRAREYG
jgi:hypothetical protein